MIKLETDKQNVVNVCLFMTNVYVYPYVCLAGNTYITLIQSPIRSLNESWNK